MDIYKAIFDRDALEKTKISRRITLLGMAGVAGVFIAGCVSQSDTATPAAQATVAPTPTTQATVAPTSVPVATTEATTTTAVTAGQTMLSYRGHTAPVLTTAWSPNGKLIASGDSVGQVHLWDSTAGTLQLKYQGHNGEMVKTLAWSANGQYIASGSGATGGNVQVWDAATGKLVVQYTGHPQGVNVVAWSPDGTRIASASFDKTVQIWQVI